MNAKIREHEIVSLASYRLDSVWLIDGEYHVEPVELVAAVRVFEVDASGDRLRVDDCILPFVPWDPLWPEGTADNDQYRGMVPSGKDPRKFPDLGIPSDAVLREVPRFHEAVE